jgi:hypothetical protein
MSRTGAGPIRFIGGASITTLSTPPSLSATGSARQVRVIVVSFPELQAGRSLDHVRSG